MTIFSNGIDESGDRITGLALYLQPRLLFDFWGRFYPIERATVTGSNYDIFL